MYEDDPQDKVFDVLGEAVFGGHPLGRAIIGRADVVGSAGRRRPARLPRRALRARATSSWPRPGRSTTTRSSSWSQRAGIERAGGRAPALPAAPDAAARAPALLRQGDRAVPRLPRRAGARARRRAALRAARAGQHPRRHLVLAAVPGGAREARPGLQRLLVPVALRRLGPDRPVPRHAPRQRGPRACASWPTSSSASATSPPPPRSSSAPRRTSRAASLLALESTTARMNRLGSSVLADMPLLSVDEVEARIDAVAARGPRRAGRRAAGARAAERRGHRRRRVGLPRRAGAGLGGARGVIRVGVVGRRGPRGRRGVRGRRGRRRPASSPAAPIPALGVALADILGDCDVVVDFTTPDTALDNALACVRAGVHAVIGTTGWDPSPLREEQRRATSSSRPTSPSARC